MNISFVRCKMEKNSGYRICSIICFSLIAALLCGCGISNIIDTHIVITKIYLYDFYPNGGATDAMVEASFSLLNANETRKIEMVNTEFKEIQEIISYAKAKKYNKNSRALAEKMMLFDIIDADGTVHRMYTSCESGFYDIDGKIFYSVENEDYKQWIKKIRDKYKQSSLY